MKQLKINLEILKKNNDKIEKVDKEKKVKIEKFNEKKRIFYELCEIWEKISKMTKRIEIQQILSNYFKDGIKNENLKIWKELELCDARIGVNYHGIELGIGKEFIFKVLKEIMKDNETMIYKTNLSDSIYKYKLERDNIKNRSLLYIDEVYNLLDNLAKEKGIKSAKRKAESLKVVLEKANAIEAKYIVRLLEGRLRIGLATQTILISLGSAFFTYWIENLNRLPDKKLKDRAIELVKDFYNICPSFKDLYERGLKFPIWKLNEHFKVIPGVIIKPMLASPTKDIKEILVRFGKSKFLCEYKYDGERIQIHRDEMRNVYLGSRNLENVREKYPDVYMLAKDIQSENHKSFIIDAEVVAWDLKNQKLLPFQTLSKRKRKNVLEADIKINVCIFAFDILYFDGDSLIEKPLRERRKILHLNFPEISSKFHHAVGFESEKITKIENYMENAISNMCEGLIIKKLDSESMYEPSKRSKTWLKLKKDYLENIGDSLDLVPIGLYYGMGKRESLYGGFLLAVYNQNSQKYEAICKVGTGFSESKLEDLFSSLSKCIISKRPDIYDVGECVPDIWISPNQVWEVKATEFTISTVYTAARCYLGPKKGISLRFPRFLRIRDDKSPIDSTSSFEIFNLYKLQIREI